MCKTEAAPILVPKQLTLKNEHFFMHEATKKPPPII